MIYFISATAAILQVVPFILLNVFHVCVEFVTGKNDLDSYLENFQVNLGKVSCHVYLIPCSKWLS